MLWMAALATLVVSGVAIHCWAAEVVAFALAKLQALGGLHAPTDVPENSSLGRPCVALSPATVARSLLLGLTLAWSCRSPTGARLRRMTASIRAFDCLNPRLLSAQPWELLRIPLVGPEAHTSSVPIQLSLLLVSLPANWMVFKPSPPLWNFFWGWQRRPPSWATDKHGLLGAPGFHVYAPRSFQGLGARRTLPFSRAPPCLSAQQRSWMVLRLRALGSQWAMGLATLPPGFLPSEPITTVDVLSSWHIPAPRQPWFLRPRAPSTFSAQERAAVRRPGIAPNG